MADVTVTAKAKVTTKLAPIGITVMPIQPKTVGIKLIIEEAEPVSPSCCKSCRLELKGRIMEPVAEKGIKVKRKSQGDAAPQISMSTPDITKITRQIVESFFLFKPNIKRT